MDSPNRFMEERLMNASDLFLAVTLLTAPVNTPEPTPCEDRWPAVRDAIHKTAVDWEIMDPRETRYLMACRDDFDADLNLLRKRYIELKDAPRLSDCKLLPDRKTVNDLITFNRAFRKHLEEKLVWEQDRADVYNEAIRETDVCYRQWDAMRDAQCDFYYVTVRRAALLKAKELWGKDAKGEYNYLRTEYPPYVPDWRFVQR